MGVQRKRDNIEGARQGTIWAACLKRRTEEGKLEGWTLGGKWYRATGTHTGWAEMGNTGFTIAAAP